VAAIAAGDNATYAVKTNGTLWAWGTNIYNELGDGTTTSRNTPVQVKGPNGVGFLTGVVAVAAGDWHAVALKSNGTVWSWGWNGEGSIGDNTTTQRATPVQVVGLGGVGTLTNITQIASDEYSTLALKSDGTAWAWGGNGYGELGDNTTTQRRAPVQVVGPNGVGFLNSVTTLAASVYTGHALRADGTVWSWGYGANGQLATDTTANSSTPIRAVSPNGLGVFPGARAIVSGYYHTLVLKTDGTVYGFGYNIEGELGDGTTSHRSVAVQTRGPGGVGVLEDVLFIAAGGYHSVALKEDGTVWAWGWNANGQLGDGTQTNRNTPVQVMGLGGNGFLTNIVAIAAGSAHTLALRRDGRVFGWGANSYGGLGNVTGSGSTYPTEMVNENGTGPLGAIISIAAGDYHSLMLGANGRVFATGYNVSGQLGDNTTTNRSRPVRVVGPGGSGALTDVVSIAAGGQFSLGLKFDGTVFAWGQNSYGQLGDNTTTDRHAPVPVVGPGGAGTLANVATVAAGRNHALAVKFDGTVWAWGLNDNGQLGDNTGVNRPAPVQAKGPEGNGFLESIFSVSAGNSHSVAINGEGILQGNVILQSAICSGALITFEFRPQPGGTPFLRTIIAGPLGLFTFNDIPPGTYDVAVKGSKWLQRVIPDVNTNNNVLNLRVFLLTGDANDDNSVDVLDLDALIRAFDKMEGDPGWNMNADFNCDESVDVLDLDLLIQNFDLVGDP
jgi:alpha-tubulin suppressor-like RCC1 family protein